MAVPNGLIVLQASKSTRASKENQGRCDLENYPLVCCKDSHPSRNRSRDRVAVFTTVVTSQVPEGTFGKPLTL